MINTMYKKVYESFDSSNSIDPEIEIADTVEDAKDNYEKVPDEFVEYKYNDKLADIRKDIDYFKGRLDDSESNEAKEKYMKLISELVEQEKQLLGITSLEEKHELDKQNYIASKVTDAIE